MSIRALYLQKFPAHAEVFVEPEPLTHWTFPLCSLALKKVNPLWEGRVTWVYSLEDPYDPAATQHANDLCIHDMRLSFHRAEGKYRFAADPGFFVPGAERQPFVESARAAYQKAVDRGGSMGKKTLRFGGRPKWVQSDETPRGPDGKKMHFVGQVYSGDFFSTLCDKDLYLFYAPEHDLVTQITQLT
jgi:hypothetical protein